MHPWKRFLLKSSLALLRPLPFLLRTCLVVFVAYAGGLAAGLVVIALFEMDRIKAKQDERWATYKRDRDAIEKFLDDHWESKR